MTNKREAFLNYIFSNKFDLAFLRLIIVLFSLNTVISIVNIADVQIAINQNNTQIEQIEATITDRNDPAQLTSIKSANELKAKVDYSKNYRLGKLWILLLYTSLLIYYFKRFDTAEAKVLAEIEAETNSKVSTTPKK